MFNKLKNKLGIKMPSKAFMKIANDFKDEKTKEINNRYVEMEEEIKNKTIKSEFSTYNYCDIQFLNSIKDKYNIEVQYYETESDIETKNGNLTKYKVKISYKNIEDIRQLTKKYGGEREKKEGMMVEKYMKVINEKINDSAREGDSKTLVTISFPSDLQRKIIAKIEKEGYNITKIKYLQDCYEISWK